MCSLNRYQQIVVDGYADGEFAQVSTLAESEQVGDGLFSFLLRELSDSEDCDSMESAIQRLEVVIKEANACLFLLEVEASKGPASNQYSASNDDCCGACPPHKDKD
jgi:hypothetical protein